VVTIILQME